jgi:hypothetical protein
VRIIQRFAETIRAALIFKQSFSSALAPMTRHGKREGVYWTYSYGPIDDESAPTNGGYAAVKREAEREGLPLLPKPFTLDTLAAALQLARTQAAA